MTRRWPQIALPLAGVLALAGQVALAQTLNEFRSAVHTPNPSTPSKPAPRRSSHDWDDDSDDFMSKLAVATVAAPFYLPHAAFDDPCSVRFASYSAQQSDVGYKDTEWFYRCEDYVTSARAQVDYGTNFDAIESIGTKLQVDLPVWRMTLDGSISNYFEDVAAGGRDHLTIGDANLVFRFAQGERIVWRSGLGVNWLADTHNDAGFNFTYGLDVLPRDPFVFSTEIDLGTLGHSTLFRSRTTLGMQWRELEIYTGYEYLNLDSVNLSSMLFGLRYWW